MSYMNWKHSTMGGLLAKRVLRWQRYQICFAITPVWHCMQFGGYRRFIDVEPHIIHELIGIHVRAIARLTRAALPGMVRRRYGAVVNVSSILALTYHQTRCLTVRFTLA
jgi:NAD(P)-dependent dehydrogenase (short-subunit alcohol dehydrogenase family)